MKLVIGSYVLDGVSSTAYEQFIAYYQNTPASYITNNDIERWNTPADLTGYATQSYVTEKILDDEKALAAAISYVNSKIEGIVIPEQQDLSSYATISYVTGIAYNIIGYIIDNERVTAGALTDLSYRMSYNTVDIDLSSYATISYVTDNFIEVERAIAAAVSYVNDKVDNIGGIVVPEVDLSSYATISYVTGNFIEIEKSIASAVSYVNSKIDNIDIPEASVDLSSYTTFEDISSMGYISAAEITQMGYITEHQDLSSYITKSDLDSMSYITESDLNDYLNHFDYLTRYDLNSEFESYYNKQEINDILYSASYVSYYDVENILYGGLYLTGPQADEYYISKYELNEQSYITSTYFWDKLNSELDYYVTHDNLENSSYATQSYVMDKISGLATPDLSSYATISYVTDELTKTERAIAAAVSYVNDKTGLAYSYISYISNELINTEKAMASAVSYVNNKVDLVSYTLSGLETLLSQI